MVFGILVCGDGYRMGLGDFDTSGFGTSDGCTWQKAFSYSNVTELSNSIPIDFYINSA